MTKVVYGSWQPSYLLDLSMNSLRLCLEKGFRLDFSEYVTEDSVCLVGALMLVHQASIYKTGVLPSNFEKFFDRHMHNHWKAQQFMLLEYMRKGQYIKAFAGRAELRQRLADLQIKTWQKECDEPEEFLSEMTRLCSKLRELNL